MSDQVFSVLFPGRPQFGVLVPDGGGVPDVVRGEAGRGFGAATPDRVEDVVVVELEGRCDLHNHDDAYASPASNRNPPTGQRSLHGVSGDMGV